MKVWAATAKIIMGKYPEHEGRIAGRRLCDEQLDLSNLNLSGLDLRETYLANIDFDNSNLRGTSFKGAYMNSVRLVGADLSYADLRYAEMLRVEFGNTILDHTHLHGAVLDHIYNMIVVTGLTNPMYIQKNYTRIGDIFKPNSEWLESVAEMSDDVAQIYLAFYEAALKVLE